MSDNSLGDGDYYEMSDYAGFGTRLLVLLIDGAFLFGAAFVLWQPFAAYWTSNPESDPTRIYLLLLIFITVGYLVFLKRSFGTIAYLVLGLKIVTAKGGRVGFVTMAMRMMMWLLGPFNIVLDLIWLGADTESQSLRDCFLNTYVVKRNAKPIGRAPMHLARYSACGLMLAYPRVSRPDK